MAHRELPDLRTNLEQDVCHIIPVSEGGRAAPRVLRKALMVTMEDLDRAQKTLDEMRRQIEARQPDEP